MPLRSARDRRHERNIDMKSSLGEKIFWTAVALSSVGMAFYGYQRFKLIRPDLFGSGGTSGISEAERAARIAEYQRKGDALSRAAAGTRTLRAGEVCVDGVIVVIARDGDNGEAKRVIENGQPVRCEAPR
jgi:hypothetical protein